MAPVTSPKLHLFFDHSPVHALRRVAVMGIALLIGIVISLLSIADVYAADIIHVKTAVSGSGSGSSWGNATTLQDALQNRAESGDEIWVAAGVYTPGIEITDTFTLVPGVGVYGGFVGIETERSQRDWETNVTVLSGDINGDDYADVNGVVRNTSDIVEKNSIHVVFVDGVTAPVTSTTILDGFTITAGHTDDQYDPPLTDNSLVGGGLYCDGGNGGECSPTIANAVFSGNYAYGSGGALFNNGASGTSSPTLYNVVFAYNKAGTCGAVYGNGFRETSSPNMTNVIFTRNSAERGGAMCIGTGNGTRSPSFMNVSFIRNIAEEQGGAIYSYIPGVESSPVLSNVLFFANTAGSSGGAIYNSCTSNAKCNPVFNNVVFSANDSGSYGGAYYSYALYGDASPELTNVTVAGNKAELAGGFCFYSYEGVSEPRLTNVILWENDATSPGKELYSEHSHLKITSSLIQGGITGTHTVYDYSYAVDGGGNLVGGPEDDPLFVELVDPIHALLGQGDLRLQSGSPAIDAGSNDAVTLTTDLDGNPRKLDGTGDDIVTVDIGAYEAPTRYALDLTYGGKGGGQVNVEPSGSACESPCIGIFPASTVITLSATADTGSMFSGWHGAIESVDSVISVVLDNRASMTATFTALGSIHGTVTDESGNPLDDVTVKLTGDASGAVAAKNQTQTTDASGAYRFDDLLPGSYTLTFEKNDYGIPDARSIELDEGLAFVAEDVTLEPLVVTENIYLPDMSNGQYTSD